MVKSEILENIHQSMIDGQRKQAVELIDEHFIMYDFWDEYRRFLNDFLFPDNERYQYYTDMVISYHRIKNR